MSNELDEQVFNGAAGDLNGLFTQAANVNAAGAAETFATGIARFAGLVDGRHAYDLSDVRAVSAPAPSPATRANSPVTAPSHCSTICGSIWARFA